MHVQSSREMGQSSRVGLVNMLKMGRLRSLGRGATPRNLFHQLGRKTAREGRRWGGARRDAAHLLCEHETVRAARWSSYGG
ncbi:hypothetical protein M406DRAFT_354706 [Cryphonectria parasitica EP155]|uniref:Uncharacterized protein n=1 Tax=Cryphonectria parasitica (strain ATCC 38755 / EP155) TaxID=660469 RepID=A0A9P5CTY9_CRYP1|nr:uncharacterized protein M406DRAFT_354706 [Cryphonectria parasitica EP155]KAF3771139.1 hypothetical protein M406DRAFT_354706 [Cryphonectria parasitica EP155]